MYKFLKKEAAGGKVAILKIDGMHCVSCGMNIDGELEDIEGVKSAETSYAKAMVKVIFNPKQVTTGKLKEVIESLGYKIVGIVNTT